MFTPVTTLLVSLMELVFINGKTEAYTQVNLKMDSNTGRETGRKSRTVRRRIALKANTPATRRMGKELSRGRAGTSILEAMSTTSVMGMARCGGRTDLPIKGSG